MKILKQRRKMLIVVRFNCVRELIGSRYLGDRCIRVQCVDASLRVRLEKHLGPKDQNR